MTRNIEMEVTADVNAASLDAVVAECERTGATSRLQQMAALSAINDSEGFKQIVSERTGATYAHFTEYCETRVPSMNPTSISQGLTVSRKLSGFPLEQLAACGIDKLYVSLRLMDKDTEGFTTLEEVVAMAASNSYRTLRDLNSSRREEKDTEPRVQLFSETVPQVYQNRMTALYNKYKAVLTSVAGAGEAVSTLKTLDFFFTTSAGLPDPYLAQVAEGKGGSAPTEDGHYIHVTTLEEITLYLAEQYYAQGTPLDQLIEHMQNATLGLQEKQKDEMREVDLMKSGREKAEKEAARTRGKLAAKVMKSKPGETIVSVDGSEYLVGDTFTGDTYPECGSIHLKLTRDGTDTKIQGVTAKGKIVSADKVAEWGVVEIKPVAKPIGISKEQQLGKKAKKVVVQPEENHEDRLAAEWLA